MAAINSAGAARGLRRVGPDTWPVHVVDIRFAPGLGPGLSTGWLADGTLASRDSGPLPDYGDSTQYR